MKRLSLPNEYVDMLLRLMESKGRSVLVSEIILPLELELQPLEKPCANTPITENLGAREKAQSLGAMATLPEDPS